MFLLKKCEFCAKEITYFEQYCSDDCHANANRFYENCEKHGKLFSIINSICIFGIPVGVFLFPFAKTIGTIIAALSCFILGIMIIFLPFPTDGMISKYKIQKAVKLTRIFGLLVIALGVLICGFLLFFSLFGEN